MAFQVTSSQHKYIIVCCMKLLHALLKVMTILSLLTQEKKINGPSGWKGREGE